MDGERRRGHVRNAYACGHKTESSETINRQVLGEGRITVLVSAQSARQEIRSEEARSQTRFRRAQGPLIGRCPPSRFWSRS
jgi:hypothetical protein